MWRRHLYLLFIIFPFGLQAQSGLIKYDWIENRELYDISEPELTDNEIILKNYVCWQYLYEEGLTSPSLFITYHKIIKVNSIDAIQRNNKIYISTYDLIDIIDLKARSIDKKGREVIFNKNNIKEIKDEEEGGFKIFAVEGVELGGEIEYFYTKKVYSDYFGRIYIQERVPVNIFEFDLICPINLDFKFKVYNDSSEVVSSISDSARFYSFVMNNVTPLFNEDFSYYNPNRIRIEFKLNKNYSQGMGDIYTWDAAAQRVYDIIYYNTKAEKKALEKLAKQLKLKSLKDDVSIIKAVENFIKSNIFLQDISSPQLMDIEFILNNKFGNKKGHVRLYAGLFKILGINHEIVLTSERDKVKFDASFDTWNYLNTYLIYFPQLESFIAPEHPEYRYNMIPSLLTATDGLFIERVTVGDYETAIAKIKNIPPMRYDKNYDNLFIKVRIDENFEKSIIDIKREFGGQTAIYIQPYFPFMEEEQKQEVLKNIIKTSAEDATFNFVEAENVEINMSPLEYPFIVKAEIESLTLIERAGNNIIFKIGDVIAEQKEMYQEKERQTDVENNFNRSYYREISFQIPEGYNIKNPEKLDMNVVYEKEDENIYAFISRYEINNSILNIYVDEYYKDIYCEKEHFEEFRKVVNAAADFNKIVLVLEKK